jgi:transcriptional regulator with XRE-family HTH domain
MLATMTPAELQRWRRRRRLTQDQAAELIGVTRNSVNRWEMGLHPISRRTARMIEMLGAVFSAARRGRKRDTNRSERVRNP